MFAIPNIATEQVIYSTYLVLIGWKQIMHCKIGAIYILLSLITSDRDLKLKSLNSQWPYRKPRSLYSKIKVLGTASPRR